MAKAKLTNFSSIFSKQSNQNKTEINTDNVIKKGNLIKMENNKTKYFVLRCDSKDSPACLEYYENSSKFKDGSPPRKKYLIKDCYISRKSVEKKQFVFNLFISNVKCKTLMATSEEDFQDWLSKLHLLKREISGYSNPGNIEYQRIWRVEIIDRGLASSLRLFGGCLVCLTDWSLWLVISENDTKEIPLHSIKTCQQMNKFFVVEVSRQSGMGSGSMFMKTEDEYIAQNMVDNVKDSIQKYGKEQDNTERAQQRARVSSFSNASLGTPSVLPTSQWAANLFWKKKFGKSRKDEDQCSREYMGFTPKDLTGPSSSQFEYISSPTLEIEPPLEQDESAYLTMSPVSSSSCNTRSSSTPIPIAKQAAECSHHEMSPQSEHSSVTSATTSSDHLHDLESTSGSESLVGSCFGPAELLDRPVRTSSVGSKPDQFKRKNSAPIVNWSAASHSWSGTSGTHFRYFGAPNHSREEDSMMLDYSNPNINNEEKEKKGGFWSSLGGHRIRSNSKSSSRSSNVKLSDSKEDTSRPVDIPNKKRSDDYCEMDYQNRPNNMETKGYLPMTISKTRAGNSLERKIIIDRPYLEMSPTADLCLNNNGYVDMTQSGSSLSISSEVSNSSGGSNLPQGHSGSQEIYPFDKAIRRNNKKTTKGKLIIDRSKRKSDADKYSTNFIESSKNKGAFSSITSRIIRKGSTTSKSPVNTTQLAKPSPPSPMTILPPKQKDPQEGFHGTFSLGSASSSVPLGFRLSERNEEKMLITPREECTSSQLKKISELSIAETEILRSNHIRDSTGPMSLDAENRNYVNLSLNISSPQINQSKPEFPDKPTRLSANITPDTAGYLIMTCKKPSGEDQASNQTASRLEPTLSHNSIERSRSLSGPGGVLNTAPDLNKYQFERTSSASSSPTSRSPPISPGLGSISSICSLGEGGLSSASSTCTVVNVGTKNKYPSGSNPQDVKVPTINPSSTSAETDKQRPASLNINYASLDLVKASEGSPKPSRSGKTSTDTSRSGKTCIDSSRSGKASADFSSRSVKTSTDSSSRLGKKSNDSNYCEIDFIKSEGLRNTSLARNSTCQ